MGSSSNCFPGARSASSVLFPLPSQSSQLLPLLQLVPHPQLSSRPSLYQTSSPLRSFTSPPPSTPQQCVSMPSWALLPCFQQQQLSPTATLAARAKVVLPVAVSLPVVVLEAVVLVPLCPSLLLSSPVPLPSLPLSLSRLLLLLPRPLLLSLFLVILMVLAIRMAPMVLTPRPTLAPSQVCLLLRRQLSHALLAMAAVEAIVHQVPSLLLLN